MALNFIDGFDQYGEQPNISSVLPSVMLANGYTAPNLSGAIGCGASYGRFSGSRGLRFTASSFEQILLVCPGFGNQATRFVGVAMYLVSIGDNQVLWSFQDSGTTQIDFRYRAGGVIQITRNGTIVATGVASMSLGQWYYIEMKVTVNSSTGFAEWRQNGVSIINFSGNTQATANAYSNLVAAGGNPTAAIEWWLDDLVVFDSSGSSPNAYLGDKTIRMKPASAVGDKSDFTQNWAAWAASTVMAVGQQIKDSNNNVQRVTAITGDFKTGSSPPSWATTGGNTTADNHVTWTVVGTGASPGAANWMAVAESPADGDSSYNSSSTIGNIDRFVSAAFPATCTGIVLVYETISSRKDDAGTRSLRGSINSGGTVADNGTDFTQNSTYAQFNPFFLVDPNTGAAWTIGAVNGLTGWGYKVTA